MPCYANRYKVMVDTDLERRVAGGGGRGGNIPNDHVAVGPPRRQHIGLRGAKGDARHRALVLHRLAEQHGPALRGACDRWRAASRSRNLRTKRKREFLTYFSGYVV